MILGIIVSLIFLILALLFCILTIRYLKKIQTVKIQQNEQIQKIQKLEKQINDKEIQIIALSTKESSLKDNIKKAQNQLTDIVKKQEEVFNQQTEIIRKRVQEYQQLVNKSANHYIDNVEKRYEAADAAHAQKIARIKAEQNEAAAALNRLKETRKAAHEALLKQQEIKENKDNYRLIPSPADLQDIHSLEKIRQTFHKPRVISMLIWQYYFQPLAKKQFPIILKQPTKMGIYKITNIKTDQAYIGQSINIYKRFCQHCKAGLGIDTPIGNKFYKAIQEYGLENFTFEVLCQCTNLELNEKEKYFIELYQADLFGYNSTKGNK